MDQEEPSSQEPPSRSPSPTLSSDHPIEHPGGTQTSCAFDLIDATQRLGDAPCRWLVERAQAALHVIGVTGEVRTRVVDDTAMSKLHAETLDDPETTDILTFDLREADDGPLDTDLVICLDEAHRVSKDMGHPVERELLLYVIHGVLHCAGFDDTTEAEHTRMHAEEDRILEAIGVGRVFAPAAGSSSESEGAR